MILGDLLDARVLAHDGGQVGYVVDVRLALEVHEDDGNGTDQDREHADPQDRPLAGQVRRRDAIGSAEVVGLLVSPRTGSSFLGYERTGVRSPWPIAAIVRRRHRGTFLVAWDDITAIADEGVTLESGFERRDPSLAAN